MTEDDVVRRWIDAELAADLAVLDAEDLCRTFGVAFDRETYDLALQSEINRKKTALETHAHLLPPECRMGWQAEVMGSPLSVQRGIDAIRPGAIVRMQEGDIDGVAAGDYVVVGYTDDTVPEEADCAICRPVAIAEEFDEEGAHPSDVQIPWRKLRRL